MDPFITVDQFTGSHYLVYDNRVYDMAELDRALSLPLPDRVRLWITDPQAVQKLGEYENLSRAKALEILGELRKAVGRAGLTGLSRHLKTLVGYGGRPYYALSGYLALEGDLSLPE